MGARAKHEQTRQLLGQCRGRKLLCHAQKGVSASRTVSNTRTAKASLFFYPVLLHRGLLQPTKKTFCTGLHQPARLRADALIYLSFIIGEDHSGAKSATDIRCEAHRRKHIEDGVEHITTRHVTRMTHGPPQHRADNLPLSITQIAGIDNFARTRHEPSRHQTTEWRQTLISFEFGFVNFDVLFFCFFAFTLLAQ